MSGNFILQPEIAFAQLLEQIGRDLGPSYVFGGANTFVGEFVNARVDGRLAEQSKPGEFLWPAVFWRSGPKVPLSPLPVYRVRQEASGLFIHLFEDLTNGCEDDYAEAAHRLGLRSIWELRRPEV